MTIDEPTLLEGIMCCAEKAAQSAVEKIEPTHKAAADNLITASQLAEYREELTETAATIRTHAAALIAIANQIDDQLAKNSR